MQNKEKKLKQIQVAKKIIVLWPTFLFSRNQLFVLIFLIAPHLTLPEKNTEAEESSHV